MQVDDPPYLPVGTAVSAKYKGAFCEAKVSKVVRVVKCKVTYKMGLGTATVSDEQVKGTLRVGHTVQVKHSERKEYVEATIGKIQDCSQYTVVFDDGDITTLRRTALCLKSGRHFNESETLDQLPLTHPEHFGNPVVGGRRGRRNRQLKEDSSDSEAEDENEPDLEAYMRSVGRVVNIEGSDKKKSKENWFPCLIVSPSIQPAVKINVKDEFLVRSFKDGRYYTVPKKEIIQFHREMSDRIENAALSEAVSKALNYIDKDELPVHWERNALFKTQMVDTDSDYNFTDSSDDEQNEEKDRFVAQLYKFMDDSGTPLNKSPVIANKDVDLHKLFRVVQKSGGYNRVTNKNKWKSVANRLRLPTNQLTFNQVKGVYKKCLFSYEGFHKTLGVTMLNHTRSTKKNRGRSLIRDRDRATPINSPKPDKDEAEEAATEDGGGSRAAEAVVVLEKGKQRRTIEAPSPAAVTATTTTTAAEKRRSAAKEMAAAAAAAAAAVENSDTTSSSSSSDATDLSESVASTSRDVGRPRRVEKTPSSTVVVNVGRKVGKVERSSSARSAGEKAEKREDDEKQTRSKSQATTPKTSTSGSSSSDKASMSEPPRKKVSAIAAAAAAAAAAASAAVAAAAAAAEARQEASTSSKTAQSKVAAKKASAAAQREEQEKKAARGRKKNSTATSADDKAAADSSTTSATAGEGGGSRHTVVSIGDKLKVYYGPTLESKVTYEAKVLEIDKDPSGLVYLVHYTGWNTRYDEWIAPARIAENLSATTKAKRLKHTAASGGSGGSSSASQTSTKTGSTGATKTTPVGASASSSATKRGRGMSITGRSAISTETPARSTTPSSITSSSSRTKSPATPATRSASRKTRLDYSRKTRRASAQTDLSNHESEESDSEISEDESSEPTRTRSSSAKTEDVVVAVPVTEVVKETIRTYKKKPVRTTTIVAKPAPKEIAVAAASVAVKEEDVEKDEERRPSRRTTRKIVNKKSSPEKSAEDSDEEAGGGGGGNQTATAGTSAAPPAKGRDFDLNQIRSELKGFSKALKVPTSSSLEDDDDDDADNDDDNDDDDDDDKEASSSSSSGDDSGNSSNQPLIKFEDVEVKKEMVDNKQLPVDKKPAVVKRESSPPLLPPAAAAAATSAASSLSSCFEDVYEFKEPEPFEFETRPIKTTPKRNKPTRSPDKTTTTDGIGGGGSPPDAAAAASERKRTREQSVVKKLDLDDSGIDDKKKKLDEFDKVRQSPSFNIVKSGGGGGGVAVEKPTPPPPSQPSASVEHVRKSLEDSFNDDFDDSNDSSTAPIFPNFSDGEEKSPKTCDLFAESSDGKKDDDDDDLPLRSFRPTMSSDDSDNANFAPVTYQNKKRTTTTTTSTAIIGETSGPTGGTVESTTSSFFLATASSVDTKPLGSSATTTTTPTTPSTTPPTTTTTTITTTATTIADVKPKIEIDESKSLPSSSPASASQQQQQQQSPSSPQVKLKVIPEALQEPNLSALKPFTSSVTDKLNEPKDLATKERSTRIVDTILQKFSRMAKSESSSDGSDSDDRMDLEPDDAETEYASKIELKTKPVADVGVGGISESGSGSGGGGGGGTTAGAKKSSAAAAAAAAVSDTDSSDSEQLVIARSDDDSQTNSMDMKSQDLKADLSDSNLSSAQIESTNDDSQEEARNFKFDDKSPSPEPPSKLTSASSPDSDTTSGIKHHDHHPEAIAASAGAASSTAKEDEPDSHLHSLLLCEETIPRSPAPSSESHSTTPSSSTATSTVVEQQQLQQQQQQQQHPPSQSQPQQQTQQQHQHHHHHHHHQHHQLSSSSRSAIANAVAIASIKAKSIGQLVEMPFASAPSSSNNKMLLLNEQPLLKTGALGSKADIPKHLKQLNRPLPPAPLVMPPLDRDRDGSTVMENTPPTTPESTISNLSPRGDDPDMSPNTMEHESCKESNDAEPEYLRKRRTLHKSSIFNEEDSMMGESSGHMGMKRPRDELGTPAACRKRRKSARMSDGLDMVPSKRGRKPMNRSRHNSDSDEDSEDLSLCSSSANLTMTSSAFDRSSRSPRPSKYNFVVEFDPTLDSGQRIAVLQQKLSELRKTYAEVRTELAAVERRRKKIRRREREGKCRRI